MRQNSFEYKSTPTKWAENDDFFVLEGCYKGFPSSFANKLDKKCDSLIDELSGGQKRQVKKSNFSSFLKTKYFLKTNNESIIEQLTEVIIEQFDKFFSLHGDSDIFSNDYNTRIKSFAKMLNDNRNKKEFGKQSVPSYLYLFFEDTIKADNDVANEINKMNENSDDSIESEENIAVKNEPVNKALKKKNKDLIDKNEKLQKSLAEERRINKDLRLDNSRLEKENKTAKSISDKNIELEAQIISLNNNISLLRVENDKLLSEYVPQQQLADALADKDRIIKESEEYRDFYEKHSGKYIEPVSISPTEVNFIEAVKCQAMKTDMCYSTKDLVNFHIAIKSSQLVILAGASGTGKTQLPFVYTSALNMSEENGDVLFIPITPSYTEPSDILGYFKPNMNSSGKDDASVGRFMESPTELVSFLVKASKPENQNKIFFVVFDEMNLSQIEYWFSPFMSILERKEDNRSISLYSKKNTCENKDDFPSDVKIGKNVFFIGTINLDETTKDMSDRLSDRAIVINLEKNKFSEYYGEKEESISKNIVVSDIDGETFMGFVRKNPEYINIFTKEEIEFFDKLDEQIRSANAQKGVSFRTLKTIANYISNAESVSTFMSRAEALDYAIKQTVIVKINGSDNSIKTLLSSDDVGSIVTILDDPKYKNISDFKLTKQSIENKRNELKNYGFTR